MDMKDRKILYQLDLNCRQSNTQIGKKVSLNRDVVAYRINRLQNEGIIRNFFTVIDSYKLGYHVFRIYLNFQYTTLEVKNQIIEFLVKDKHTWVVNSIIGRYDLGVHLWLKDFREFYNFWEKILDKYGDYFEQKIFSVYVKAYSYPNSYLLLDEYKKIDREKYEIVGVGKKIEIDDLDFKILNELAENARIPLIDIAEKLNCTSQTINYRIKNLVKLGIIQAFRVGIDISKLGYQYYKVDIYLKEHSQRNPIINFIKYNPYLTFIGTSAGVSDLELEFDVENSIKLNHIIDEINTKFPGMIKKYDYFTISKTHKVRCIPEL